SSPLKAPDLLTWKEDRGTLEAKFRSPKDGSFRVEIGMEREAKPGLMRLPVILDPNAHLQRGGAVVYVDKRFSPRLKSVGGARLVDLPAVKDKRILPFRGFQYLRPDPKVEIDLRAVRAKTRAFARNLIRVEESELRLDSWILVHVREGELFEQAVTLPPGFTADAIHLVGAEGEWKLAGDGSSLQLTFRKPIPAGRRFQVCLSMRSPIETQEGKDETRDLPVVSVPGAEEEGVVGISAPESVRVVADKLSGLKPLEPGTPISAFRIRDPQLKLAYRYDKPGYSGILEIRRESPQVSLTSTVFYGLRGSSLFTAAHLRYRIRKAAVDRVAFLLPPGVEKGVMVQGAGAKPASTRKTKDGTEWTVPLQTRVLGAYDLYVTFPVPLQGISGNSQVLPWIRGLEVSSEMGRIAVEASEEARIAVEAARLEETDPEEVEMPAGFWTGGRALFAWKYAKPGWTLSIAVSRHETQDVARVIVERLRGTIQVDPAGGETVRAVFTVMESGLQDFRMAMPDGAELWSLTMDGVGVKPARDGNLLIAPLDPRGPTRRTITVVYRRPHNGFTALGRFGTSYPEVIFEGESVSVLQSSMAVIVPEDFQLVAASGSMTPLFTHPRARSLLRRAYEKFKGLAILLVLAVLFAIGLITFRESVSRIVYEWIVPYRGLVNAVVGGTALVALLVVMVSSFGGLSGKRAYYDAAPASEAVGLKSRTKYKKSKSRAHREAYGLDEAPMEDPVLKDAE
ncbi:MAG: hypothetical protein ACYS47_21240, partial [Planctomycetota bacterium]